MAVQRRQICLVAADLRPVIDDLTWILGINTCYIDPDVSYFGLENTLMPIGRNFLEVVAPVKENTTAGRYLERRSGNGGYMVICQADSRQTQGAVRQRALENGVRVAYELDRDNWGICQLHPADMTASFFEIDWDSTHDFDGNWHPAGGSGWEGEVKQDVTVDYAGVELQSDDPGALAQLWSRVSGIALDNNGGDLCLPLNNVNLRFVEAVDGRGAGLSGIDLVVNNRQHILAAARERGCYVSDHVVSICGTFFYLQDAG